MKARLCQLVRAALTSAVATALPFLSAPAFADAYTWTGNANDGLFESPANWDSAAYPATDADTVAFALARDYAVVFADSVTNGALTLTAGNVALDIGAGHTYGIAADSSLDSATPASLTLASGTLDMPAAVLTVGKSWNSLSNTLHFAEGTTFAAKKIHINNHAQAKHNRVVADSATIELANTSAYPLEFGGTFGTLELINSTANVRGNWAQMNGTDNAIIVRGGSTLNIYQNLYLNGSRNHVEVTGAGSELNIYPGNFGLSTRGSNGSVRIADGGRMTSSRLDFLIGQDTARGVLFTVADGGTLTAGGTVYIGATYSDNTLVIEKGGRVTAPAISVKGTLHADGGTVVNAGTLTLKDGAALVVANNPVLTNNNFVCTAAIDAATIEFRIADGDLVPVRFNGTWTSTDKLRLVIDASEYADNGGNGQTLTLLTVGSGTIAAIPAENITVTPALSQISQDGDSVSVTIVKPDDELPAVATLEPAYPTATTATLFGELLDLGWPNLTAVHLYWGGTDGRTSAAAWDNCRVWDAPQSVGTFSHGLEDFTDGAVVHYRFAASNATGFVWADASRVATAVAASESPYTWTGGGADDAFENPANWGASTYPRFVDDVVLFSVAGDHAVAFARSVENQSLALAAGNVALDIGNGNVYGLGGDAVLNSAAPARLDIISGELNALNHAVRVGNSATAASNTLCLAAGARLEARYLGIGSNGARHTRVAATNAVIRLKQADTTNNNSPLDFNGSNGALELSGGTLTAHGWMALNYSDNAMLLRDGAKLNLTGHVYLNGSSNRIEVTGAGSELTANGNYSISNGGTDCEVYIADGGTLRSSSMLHIGRGGARNTLVVGSGGTLSLAALAIGTSTSAGHTLVVTEGGNLAANSISLWGGTLLADGGVINTTGVFTFGGGSTVTIANNAAFTNQYFYADSTTAPMTLALNVADGDFSPVRVNVTWRNTDQLKLVVDATEYAAAGGLGQTVTLVSRKGMTVSGDYLAEIPAENITVRPAGCIITQTPTEITCKVLQETTLILVR